MFNISDDRNIFILPIAYYVNVRFLMGFVMLNRFCVVYYESLFVFRSSEIPTSDYWYLLAMTINGGAFASINLGRWISSSSRVYVYTLI